MKKPIPDSARRLNPFYQRIRKIDSQTFAAILAAVTVAAAGSYFLHTTRAASYASSAEAERGSLTGAASVFSESTASGGRAVRFGSLLQYTFDDEFNGPAGSAPNTSLWQHDIDGYGWGNQELEYYTDGNANSYLDGQGHLVIEADQYSGSTYQCWYGTCKYTSARLQTQHEFSQSYGHFEARIELPNQETGLWPAFWLLDTNTSSRGEIDIFENYGADAIEGSLHGDTPSLDTSDDFNTTDDNPTGWHTYAIDWSPTQVSFSIDGKVYATHTKAELGSDWAFNQPYYILLNLAVGGSGTGGKTPTTLPGKILIDYVRVSK